MPRRPVRRTPLQTAGLLESLLDLLFWAIGLLAPVYVVLVMVGYQRSGGAEAFRRGAQLEEDQALTV